MSAYSDFAPDFKDRLLAPATPASVRAVMDELTSVPADSYMHDPEAHFAHWHHAFFHQTSGEPCATIVPVFGALVREFAHAVNANDPIKTKALLSLLTPLSEFGKHELTRDCADPERLKSSVLMAKFESTLRDYISSRDADPSRLDALLWSDIPDQVQGLLLDTARSAAVTSDWPKPEGISEAVTDALHIIRWAAEHHGIGPLRALTPKTIGRLPGMRFDPNEAFPVFTIRLLDCAVHDTLAVLTSNPDIDHFDREILDGLNASIGLAEEIMERVRHGQLPRSQYPEGAIRQSLDKALDKVELLNLSLPDERSRDERRGNHLARLGAQTADEVSINALVAATLSPALEPEYADELHWLMTHFATFHLPYFSMDDGEPMAAVVVLILFLSSLEEDAEDSDGPLGKTRLRGLINSLLDQPLEAFITEETGDGKSINALRFIRSRLKQAVAPGDEHALAAEEVLRSQFLRQALGIAYIAANKDPACLPSGADNPARSLAAAMQETLLLGLPFISFSFGRKLSTEQVKAISTTELAEIIQFDLREGIAVPALLIYALSESTTVGAEALKRRALDVPLDEDELEILASVEQSVKLVHRLIDLCESNSLIDAANHIEVDHGPAAEKAREAQSKLNAVKKLITHWANPPRTDADLAGARRSSPSGYK